MHLIVGLGNPGSAYFFTRHNLGFLIADELAANSRSKFQPGKGDFWLALCSLKETEFVVMKPATFMNNSGTAVRDFIDQHGLQIERLLVVCDDFQIPFGTLRMRPNGTDGGHNGLASIIYHLQTDQFARLRCGIGSDSMPKDKGRMKDFVLEQFAEPEMPRVREMVDRAQLACRAFVSEGIERTMNRFNAASTTEEVS